jgi:hypothetical protein
VLWISELSGGSINKLYWGDHLPECYTGTTPCEHTPLAWSRSLAVALRAAVQ